MESHLKKHLVKQDLNNNQKNFENPKIIILNIELEWKAEKDKATSIVPGSGAIEMELSKHVRKFGMGINLGKY